MVLKRIRKLLGRRGRKPAVQPAASSLSTADTAVRPPVHQGPKVVHRPISESDLDPDAVKIVHRLTRFDHNAYLVGGCVRDLLLERQPKDFDIGTSATPRQIKRLFRNCRIIGRRFRLAHIYFQNGKIIEVATFRALDDGNNEGGETDTGDKDLLIRDDNVFGSPEEDALRRDFTVNALFYDIADETVLDHTDGLGDLRAKLIRTIGDPETRFKEDPIRSLRAIKFAARLDFKIEAATLEALRKTRREIDKAAPPRIFEEINRFGRSGVARRSFELMRETGVFDVVFPEIAKGYKEDGPWKMLQHYLERIDTRRFKEDREVRIGEMFSVLLLPLLFDSFGWKSDGSADPPRRLNVRELLDERLRPMCLRLRAPRREQEQCRQILTSLLRMVPTSRVRRNTKRAILARECLPDALWILEATADLWGGDFAEAFEAWKSSAGEAPARAERAERIEEKERRSPREGGGRRRRSRRGSGRRKSSEADGQKQESKVAKERRDDLPPPWDDSYFFAALPSVPEMAGNEGKADRYGAAALEAETRAAKGPGGDEQPPDATETEAPTAESDEGKPRRRRRRRRRKSSA